VGLQGLRAALPIRLSDSELGALRRSADILRDVAARLGF
jgi:hypothetical protein